MIDPNLRAMDRIYSELPEKLKELMSQCILSEEEHNEILEEIKKESYENKKPEENPKFFLVAGQTGSGKSNLTSYIYSKNNNIVIIDSDRYKQYRRDNAKLLKNHLAEYAFLTAPDSYLHRDELLTDAIKSKYNILLECAPSEKDGFFVDLNKIQKAGYRPEIDAMAVSSLNSSLSVHERYEDLLEVNNVAPKLTGLSRHDDSFSSMFNSIRKLQNEKGIEINIFKRGKEAPYYPLEVYGTISKPYSYSSPLQALVETQDKDLKETLSKFEERFNLILEKMKNRNAPSSQINQLYQIQERYKEYTKEKENER